jgi:Ion channel
MILKQLLVASCLMAACVVIHATGMASALRRLRRQAAAELQFVGLCWLFIRLAGQMIVLHLVEIGIWGAIYGWLGAMGDMTSALYFSAVTYTTTGYGDLLLPVEWRLVGAIEALTGILMCGWSTGFFFAVVSRVLEAKARAAIPAP